MPKKKRRLDKRNRAYDVHMLHCNQGENLSMCKYGEHDICPTLGDVKNKKFTVWFEQINAEVVEVRALNKDDARTKAERKWSRETIIPRISDVESGWLSK